MEQRIHIKANSNEEGLTLPVATKMVNFISSSEVPENLQLAALKGLELALSIIPNTTSFNLAPSGGIAATAELDEKLKQLEANGHGRKTPFGFQYDGLSMIVNLGGYEFSNSLNLYLINKDIMLPGSGWMFGLAQPYSTSVQSVARFMNPRISESDRELAITRLIAHEAGHLIGLVERDHHVTESYGLHCTNVCIMRQTVTPLRHIKAAQEERDSGVDFCSCCRDEMRERYTHSK